MVAVCPARVNSPWAFYSRKSRRVWPCGQHRSEQGLQRFEPFLVIPPLLDTLGKDGPAHLFGTGCPHRPRVCMEREAGFLESEPTMGEQFPNLILGSGNQLLV